MSISFASGRTNKQLTARQIAIVRFLIKTPRQPVTVKAVSEQLQLSTRTIIRELDSIEGWFKENDFMLIRKPSVGLIIQESDENIALLQELLCDSKGEYTPKERRRRMLGELLSAREPIKSYVFLSRYHISRGTLTGDLNELEKWLKPMHIQLKRRPGVGIVLEGTEQAFRHAIANAAFEFVDESQLLSLIRGDETSTAGRELDTERLFQFIDRDVVSFVEKMLHEAEEKLELRYTDSGYMALVVHLSLAVKRLLAGETIEMSPQELAELEELPEYAEAVQIAQRIEQKFGVTVPRAEYGFITMHLSSARIWPQTRKGRSQLKSINTRQVVMAMVDMVEEETGIPFRTCERMIEELTSHMEAMISRLTMSIQLDNSQNEELRRSYPELYQAVENACSIFKTLLQINDITDSEVTFVAMHFIAAAEQLHEERKRVAAVVVCPSGIGASRMLAANLMRSFPSIEVKRVLSAFHLNAKELRESGVDLVISTVELSIDFPHICVSPIPQAQDIVIITQAVERIEQSRAPLAGEPAQERKPIQTNEITRSGIVSLTHTGEEILQLLNHFQILIVPEVRDAGELLGHAAGMFADGLFSRQLIAADLARRESIKSTFIPELKLYLLHCRTLAVEHCRFGYIRLTQPLTNPYGQALGAVLLLAPQSDWNECAEVISRLSMLLVEDERFLQALRAGDSLGGKALAEQSLVKYYKQQVKRIGDGIL